MLQTIEKQIPEALLQDQVTLRRKLSQIRKRMRNRKPVDRDLKSVQQILEQSVTKRMARRSNAPVIEYPPELPVSERRNEIADAIRDHQVVIVAGETGSGKTTQLPKICLELGLGDAGRIGHTQPRRIAARSVAQRIADELKTPLGDVVGYQVRFHDQVGPNSRIKLMTDGIMLAEIQHDKELLQYDTIIIDEAHERSLNIDFLLGYLRQLLPRRPDLKLVITSATIATEKFSKHFNDAPVIEVSGRTYPVEVRYHELHTEDPDEEDRDIQQGVLDAVDELSRIDRGDILIFLTGERDIREMAEALRKHHPPDTEILPLFARLSVAEQNRVFQPHGKRRIVLATNVAETSLTVPGIRYVIDTGYARISRYSYRSKVQRLPVEKISQASANQRKGRCGRVSAGICVRLYSEEDFLQRTEYTDPEIQRTNLASVILNMKVLGLGDVDQFPFMDPPDRRYINDGYRLLHEIGAVDGERKLTKLGKELARFPVDPRIARMVLQAKKEYCLKEVLIIASALTIQDPRERPLDAQQKADEYHREFRHDRSDFLSLLSLWEYFHEQGKHLSRTKLRKLCHDRFISYRRMQEWHDLHRQLATQVKEMGARLNQEEASYDAIHRSLLSGLLSNIGFRADEREYSGSHGKKFMIFPGSGLRKKGPRWLMSAEIVETSRLFARTVAAIHPDWIEQLAGHLVKRSYNEPHWEKRSGQVAALEKVTLYGLTLANNRKVNYGPIDPALSRELFIRHALVLGELDTRAEFFKHNHALLDHVQELEDKARRKDIQVDEQVLFGFYDERIPKNIYSRPAFEKWWKRTNPDDLKNLYLTEQDLIREQAQLVSDEQFPDHVRLDGLVLALEYHFKPGAEDDGVTVRVPLPVLNQLSEQRFDWLVPGLIQEKLTQLIKSLPKSLRKNFVPAPDFARACLQSMAFAEGNLLEQFAHQLKRMTGVTIECKDWNPDAIDEHLRINYRVVDEKGKTLSSGRNLQVLKDQLSGKASSTFAATMQKDTGGSQYDRDDITDWDFGDLPEMIEIEQQGIQLKAYPALASEKGKVALRLFDNPVQAESSMKKGLLALFMIRHRKDVSYIQKNLPGIQQMCMHYSTLGKCEELKQDLSALIAERALFQDGAKIRSKATFDQQAERARKSLVNTANEVSKTVQDILAEYHAFSKMLKGNINPAWLQALADIRQQVDELMVKGFLHKFDFDFLQHYPRFFRAIQRRLEKLSQNPGRDRQLMQEVQPFWQQYLEHKDSLPGTGLQHFHWMVEELRVSLFAQELKTAFPVSPKRLKEYWKKSVKTVR